MYTKKNVSTSLLQDGENKSQSKMESQRSGAYKTEFISQKDSNDNLVIVHNRFNAQITRAKSFVENSQVNLKNKYR